MDAFAKQDSNAVGALYTSDCKVMPTGADVVNGPAGIIIWLYRCTGLFIVLKMGQGGVGWSGPS